jgi:hypothetical protein
VGLIELAGEVGGLRRDGGARRSCAGAMGRNDTDSNEGRREAEDCVGEVTMDDDVRGLSIPSSAWLEDKDDDDEVKKPLRLRSLAAECARLLCHCEGERAGDIGELLL